MDIDDIEIAVCVIQENARAIALEMSLPHSSEVLLWRRKDAPQVWYGFVNGQRINEIYVRSIRPVLLLDKETNLEEFVTAYQKDTPTDLKTIRSRVTKAFDAMTAPPKKRPEEPTDLAVRIQDRYNMIWAKVGDSWVSYSGRVSYWKSLCKERSPLYQVHLFQNPCRQLTDEEGYAIE